ncbi:hypothetical protein E2C01_083797 [Portunus trituberculatus]|uniref:Uncharacterized protein n=1 Tax=Portunus trituberculatus TaxID=210409 RepID=A0A5B7J8Z2_PORTR|nr:hypothetical protein [Portunus trituberculatus]
MEEDSHNHQAEIFAPVKENVLMFHRNSPGTPGFSGSPTSTRSSRRFCSRPACTWVLGSFLHDPHSVCVRCRDICSPGKKCGECANWSSKKVLVSYKYQCSLCFKRIAKAKYTCNVTVTDRGTFPCSGCSGFVISSLLFYVTLLGAQKSWPRMVMCFPKMGSQLTIQPHNGF